MAITIQTIFSNHLHNILPYLTLQDEVSLRCIKTCQDLFEQNLTILEVMNNRSKLALSKLSGTPVVRFNEGKEGLRKCAGDLDGEISGIYNGKYLSAKINCDQNYDFHRTLDAYNRANVRVIEIFSYSITDSQLSTIFQNCPKIEKATLEGIILSGECFNFLLRSNLKSLNLRSSRFNEQYLTDNLGNCTALEHLNLASTQVTGACLEPLLGSKLKNLYLQGCSALEEQHLTKNIGRFEAIERLNLAFTRITDACVNSLLGNNLKELNVSYTDINDQLGNIFEMFPRLEVLNIERTAAIRKIISQIPRENHLKILKTGEFNFRNLPLLVNILWKCPKLSNKAEIKKEISQIILRSSFTLFVCYTFMRDIYNHIQED